MKVRPAFYAALYGSFWLSIPFAFNGKLLPVVIAAATMFLVTTFAARRDRHVV